MTAATAGKLERSRFTDVKLRAIVCALALLPLVPGREPAAAEAPRVTAVRLKQNPLITVDSSPSLGDNVNGPSIRSEERRVGKECA